MNKKITIGIKKNGAVFFNVVKNITIPEKYSSLFKITGNSHLELINNMIEQKDRIIKLKLSDKITFLNGLVRSQTTNKLRRCQPLEKNEIEKIKEIFFLLQKETVTKQEIALEEHL